MSHRGRLRPPLFLSRSYDCRVESKRRHSMKALPVFALLAMTFALPAAAQLGPKYSDWAEGPVQHLMTKEEKKQWKAVHADADAAAFIDLFWARRDPTPETPRNEFREAFDARVAYADDHFASHGTRGSLTD